MYICGHASLLSALPSSTVLSANIATFNRIFDANSVVSFDAVPLNLDHSYSESTYTYTCPTTAYYEVRLHVVGDRSGPARFGVFRNDVMVHSVYCGNPTDHDYAGVSVLLYCDQGFGLSVRSLDVTSFVLGDLYTTFSIKYVASAEGKVQITVHDCIYRENKYTLYGILSDFCFVFKREN